VGKKVRLCLYPGKIVVAPKEWEWLPRWTLWDV